MTEELGLGVASPARQCWCWLKPLYCLLLLGPRLGAPVL